jgi:ABC-2 type transport system ATP-binding protein
MASHVLQTAGLVRRFGSRRVLDGLDMTVPEGSVYGFLGRNGVGKTTTIRLVLGILRPHGGTIELAGRTVRHTTPRMRRAIGYVGQKQHFYPWMKADRLGRFVGAFYPSWDHKRFIELLRDLDVDPRQPCGQLSGGTLRKLAIAASLAHRPELLVLDEPTAGLDPVARREVLEVLKHRARHDGQTVLFSTHHMVEIEEIADHVGVLHAGRLAYEGSLDGLPPAVGASTLEAAFLHIVRGS